MDTLYAYVSRGLLASHPGPGRRRRYRREEVERLKAARPRPAEPLRWGEPLLESAVSWITPEGPVYRNHRAVDLVGRPFEVVAELLWTGDLPDRIPEWGMPPRLGMVSSELPSLGTLSLLVTSLALEDPERYATTPEAVLPRARKLISTMAAGAQHRQGRVAALLADTYGLSLSEEVVDAIDAALVLAADHELNASTFAVRVVASTGADVYACVAGGLAALSGPLHGGAGERVGALVEEIGSPGRGREVVLARSRRGDPIPGFGHPLYPEGDPRATPLLELAQALAPDLPAVRICQELVEVVREVGLGYPNLDLGLMALAAALGLPPAATGTIFAVSRTAGWVAHALEQYEAGVIIRPRARRG